MNQIKYVTLVIVSFFSMQLFLSSASAAVRISKLQDYAFGSITPDGSNQDLTQGVCIYRSGGPSSVRTYYITVSGTIPGGGLYVTNGTYNLPYRVSWSDRTSGGTFAVLRHNIKSSRFNNASRDSDCYGSTNARLRIRFTGGSLLNAESGSYHGVLKVILSDV